MKTIVYTIIVTYNGAKWINKCFGSLQSSSIPLKIIAVDNNSKDNTPQIIKAKFPDVEVIETGENLGFGKAKFTKDEVLIIDLLTEDIEDTIKLICSCEYTLSSSLHGVIVSHAYNIPSIWCKISDKLHGDNVKFYDYFSTVGIIDYNCFEKEIIDLPVNDIISIIKKNEQISNINIDIKKLQEELINSLPFTKL